MVLLVLLAAIAVFLIPKKEFHFFGLLLAWGILGSVVILMQKTSWWSYQFQLLYVPIGLLAALGLDFVLYHLLRITNPKRQFITNLLVVTVVVLAFNNQLNSLKQGIISSNYTKLYNFDYAKDDAAKIMKVIKPEETIFICGNPRMYVLTSNLPELSTNGWILEYYLDYQWEAFYE